MIKYKASDYIQIFKHTALGVDIISWLKILTRYRFSIGLPFMFKALFITFTSIFNAPFQLFEYLVFSRKVRSTKVEKPIFILGHPRSGTTFLLYLISSDTNLGFCTTTNALIPNLMLTADPVFEKMLDKVLPETRPQDNVKLSAKKPKEEEFAMANISAESQICGFYFPNKLKETFDRVAMFKNQDSDRSKWQKDFYYLTQKLTYKNKGKRLILKSPYNTARLKEILEVYPDARFIHIHRDPYTVYRSTLKLFQKVLPILGLHKTNDEYLKKYILYSYKEMYEKYLNERHEIPDGRLVEVNYGDFVKDPIGNLKMIYAELSISNFDQALPDIENELNEFGNYKTNKYAELPDDIRGDINREWGFFFEAYGYQFKPV